MTMTTIPALPGVVEAWRAAGRPMVVAAIAREADCSEWAARYYLHKLKLLGPKRHHTGPRRRRDEPDAPPTPDQIRELAAEIRRENLARLAAWVYRWPARSHYEVKTYPDPRRQAR